MDGAGSVAIHLIVDEGRLRPRTDGGGILWARRGPFRLGVERLDDDNDFKFTDSREWHDAQRADHWR